MPRRVTASGKLVFRLDGERLKGRWALIRMGGKAGQDGKNWLLKKLDDDEARPGENHDILTKIHHERRFRSHHGPDRRQHETRQDVDAASPAGRKRAPRETNPTARSQTISRQPFP